MRILLVEDEVVLAKSLKKALEKEGFAVDYVTDGEAAERRIRLYQKEYDAIILDLMLPKKDGLEICRDMREAGIKNPVLVLTARGDTDDKVNALNAGADDYLVKPFSLEELIARIRALLRRPEAVLFPKLEVRGLTLDPVSRKVKWHDREVDLTVKEFALLEYLLRHPNQVISRNQILDHIWDFEFDSFSNVVDVHMKNLRKKINGHEDIIETVRGIGYRIKA
jgi:DNA-binding response OmpR family regulator